MAEPITRILTTALSAWETALGIAGLALLAGALPAPQASVSTERLVIQGEHNHYTLRHRPGYDAYDGILVESRSGSLPSLLSITRTNSELLIGAGEDKSSKARGELLLISHMSEFNASGLQFSHGAQPLPYGLSVANGEGETGFRLGRGSTHLGGLKFVVETDTKRPYLLLTGPQYETVLRASRSGGLQVTPDPFKDDPKPSETP